MNKAEKQFKQISRVYFLRVIQIAKQKGTAAQVSELQQTFVKLINSEQLQQAIITRVINLDLKGDYQQNLLLLFLQQVAKWSVEHFQVLKDRPSPIETLISRSITLIENQQQLHSIIPKQNELIASLLVIPTSIQNLDHFRLLYRRLKDVKDYYPTNIRQSQKAIFSKTIQKCLTIIANTKAIKALQFIHGNIIQEVEQRWNEIELLPSRLRILRKMVKGLWCQHRDIAHRTAYMLMKLSYKMLEKANILGHVLNLYETLMEYFTRSDSLVPLILFEHVIIMNLKVAQKRKQLLYIEILLENVSAIFEQDNLKYFLRMYDWNFMAEGISQKTIQLVFNFTEDRENQRKPEFQLYKKCLKRITSQIQNFLSILPQHQQIPQILTFYSLIKQQHTQLLQELNQSPKKVFRRVENASEQQRENLIRKIVHIIRRSPHLQKKAMIGILSSQNVISKQILEMYLKSLMGMCQQNDLEEFLRFFISNFFLSGQAQQIERMLDELTKFFFRNQCREDKASLFKNSDSAYCFANAIIILNTDLHNPKNENKMSEESFLKMCKNINDGEDLPAEVIKKTYANIKQYQIHTFRDLSNLNGISYQNWLLICGDPAIASITYYDEQMNDINNHGFEQYARQLLSSIINEKEDATLQYMIERFEYDDKNFHCEIIQDIRKSIDKRNHLAMHMLQKVYQSANFKNGRFSDRIMSYYWLAVKIIETFHEKIPPTKLAQLLIVTVKLRMDLNDHLYTRQKIEFKNIKQCIKEAQKRASKKSIMDIFTNFLSKDSSDDEGRRFNYNKKMNYQGFGLSILEILQQSKQSKSDAIQFIIGYICNEEAKLFEQFMSLLSLAFHLIYTTSEITQQCVGLFEDVLFLKQSNLGHRLNTLRQKDPKKYTLLQAFSKYWILRISLKNMSEFQRLNEFFNETKEFIDIADKSLYLSLVNQTKSNEKVPQNIVDSFISNAARLQLDDQIEWFRNKLIKNERETQTKMLKQKQQNNIIINVEESEQKKEEEINEKEEKFQELTISVQHNNKQSDQKQQQELIQNQSIEEEQIGLPLYML